MSYGETEESNFMTWVQEHPELASDLKTASAEAIKMAFLRALYQYQRLEEWHCEANDLIEYQANVIQHTVDNRETKEEAAEKYAQFSAKAASHAATVRHSTGPKAEAKAYVKSLWLETRSRYPSDSAFVEDVLEKIPTECGKPIIAFTTIYNTWLPLWKKGVV